jgi:hypothetical protein
MAKLTKGTQIYFIDPTGNTVEEVTGVTTFNPGGAPADQIETTSLTDEAKTFMRGMRTPGQASLELNADPTNESHVRLHELAQDDTVDFVKWAVGWSDGTADPTADSDGDFDLPNTRTWFTFDGYVSDFPFDFSTNSVVKSSVQIQRTGTAVLTEATS